VKTYFVASIKGRDSYFENYKAIVDALTGLGHSVAEFTLYPSKEYVYGLDAKEKKEFYEKMSKCISEADIVVVEASYPSINVGHEITLALEKGKPVIALHINGKEPHLLQGLLSEKLLILEYSLDTIREILEYGIEEAKTRIDMRFTILLPPKIVGYLNRISKEKRIPRSVFIRNLIEDKMEEEK